MYFRYPIIILKAPRTYGRSLSVVRVVVMFLLVN